MPVASPSPPCLVDRPPVNFATLLCTNPCNPPPPQAPRPTPHLYVCLCLRVRPRHQTHGRVRQIQIRTCDGAQGALVGVEGGEEVRGERCNLCACVYVCICACVWCRWDERRACLHMEWKECAAEHVTALAAHARTLPHGLWPSPTPPHPVLACRRWMEGGQGMEMRVTIRKNWQCTINTWVGAGGGGEGAGGGGEGGCGGGGGGLDGGGERGFVV